MEGPRERRLRLAIGRWRVCCREYRQRSLAAGVWFRLRRTLADAERAFVIPEEDAAALEIDGYRPEPSGTDLEPPIRLFFLPAERIAALPRRRDVPVRLDTEILTARAVALLRFEP